MKLNGFAVELVTLPLPASHNELRSFLFSINHTSNEGIMRERRKIFSAIDCKSMTMKKILGEKIDEKIRQSKWYKKDSDY